MRARPGARQLRHLPRSAAIVAAAALALFTPIGTSSPRGGDACAQTPLATLAADADEHVFVSGVPEGFDAEAIRGAIDRIKATTGRDYRIIVVGEGPEGDRSAREVLDAILARWANEAPMGSSKAAFDPSRDVAIYVDVGRRRVAMHAPRSLETGSGLDAATIRDELIAKSFAPAAADGRVDRAVIELVEATERRVRDRAERDRARREEARVFRTRTLPMAVAGITALTAIGLVAAWRARHDRLLREARSKLDAFKQDVVALSDLLDGQQERHRMLPHSDPDFSTPMEGRTRDAYEGVQASLQRYRERWLSLMDVWERADEAIRAETALGTAHSEAAIRMLDAAEARPPLDEVARDCRAPLDDLERAHETARGRSTELGTLLAAAATRLEGLAGRGRSAASFRGPLAEVARGLELARAELEADPLSARSRMEKARAALDESTGRVEAFEAEDDRRRKASGETDDLESRLRAKRAEGFRLAEPGADPAVHVEKSRRHLDTAAQLLDAGEIEAAGKHVADAERHVAEGSALLENVIAARARVEELLPGCIARLEALSGRRGSTERALEHLAAGYAPGSWSEVADNAVKADEGLSRARAMIAEAQAAAQPDRQEYFRALALVEEAVRQEDWVERCHSAVSDRRAELDALRSSLPGRCRQVGQRVAALARRLEGQSTDRPRANEQCREADRLVQVATHGLAVERPDLPRTGQVIDAADAAAAGAERLADDDERLARQGFEEIEAADRLLRQAASWYAEGVKADVRAAAGALEEAKGLLTRQRYEDAIRAAAESQREAREALAEASGEAERRRRARQLETQRRQMEDSFVRMSRGAGPWVIRLPGGTFSGPDPWRTVPPRSGGAAPSRSTEGGWTSRTAEGGW